MHLFHLEEMTVVWVTFHVLRHYGIDYARCLCNGHGIGSACLLLLLLLLLLLVLLLLEHYIGSETLLGKSYISPVVQMYNATLATTRSYIPL